MIQASYREYPVEAELRSHFICLWTQTVSGPEGEYWHRVLPDGCVDLVMIDGGDPVVVGPWTNAFVARLAVGSRLLGARLYPGCASSLLGLPAQEIRNLSVALRDLVLGFRAMHWERVWDESNSAAMRGALSNVLVESLRNARPVDDAVAKGVRWMSRNPNGRVEQLSGWAGISNRQLQRRFVAAVGFGPKTFQEVLRFQRLLRIASGGGTGCLAELAIDAGFADQAHMTRECRRFAGCQPSLLLGSVECTLSMSDLFKTEGA